MAVTITSTDPADYVAELTKVENESEDGDPSNKDTKAAPEKGESNPDSATGGKGENKEGDKDSNSDPDKDGKDGSKAQTKRVKQAIKDKTDLERERDYWKQAALDAGKKPDTTVKEPGKKESEAKEPNPDDFEKPTDYYRAVAKYEAEKVKEVVKAELIADQKKAEAQKEQSTILKKWDESLVEARTRYKDYDEVTDRDVPLDKDGIIQETFLTSEIGADLAYWWGSHEEEAKALLKLAPVALAREVGKIEARVQAELEVGKIKEDKSSSGAAATAKPKPKPITPVTGQGGGNVEPDEDKIPYREWADKRNSKLIRRR